MDSSASKMGLAASFAAASAAWYSGSSTMPAGYGVGLTDLSSLVESPWVITSYGPFWHPGRTPPLNPLPQKDDRCLKRPISGVTGRSRKPRDGAERVVPDVA